MFSLYKTVVENHAIIRPFPFNIFSLSSHSDSYSFIEFSSLPYKEIESKSWENLRYMWTIPSLIQLVVSSFPGLKAIIENT